MGPLVTQLNEIIKSSPDARALRKDVQNKTIIGQFFKALKL